MNPSNIPGLLSLIEQGDGAIGAFWQLDAEGALAAAADSGRRRARGASLGPLDGVAVAVKDNVDVAGLRTTAGIAAYRQRVAAADAPLVAALKSVGALIIGKAAMHEGALGATTDTPGFGRCMNPLRPGFTPGGSSGGSAAAVAAGFAELAVGTDTMGSVRLPAAYCGIVGLKPSAGLVSRSGVVPLSPRLDHVGMLARTPRAAALGLEAMVCHDEGDPDSRPAPQGWGAAPEAQPHLSTLRVGLPEPILAAAMEPCIRAAWDAAAVLLRRMGATVAPVAMRNWAPSVARRAGLLLIEAEAAALHPGLVDDPDAASAGFRAALAYGRDAGAIRLMQALFRVAEVRGCALRALDDCDVLLMPTAPQRAFAHGSPAPVDQADFTALANIAGLPSIAIPWAAEDDGLPCSIQITGRPHAERMVVGVAEALLGA